MEKISKTVRAGAITYFLDIKQSRQDKPFLVITASRYKGEHEKRERNKILIFQESIPEFVETITELSARLGQK